MVFDVGRGPEYVGGVHLSVNILKVWDGIFCFAKMAGLCTNEASSGGASGSGPNSGSHIVRRAARLRGRQSGSVALSGGGKATYDGAEMWTEGTDQLIVEHALARVGEHNISRQGGGVLVIGVGLWRGKFIGRLQYFDEVHVATTNSSH